MYCSKCGKEVREEAKFCPSCGAPLEAVKAQETVKAVSAQEPTIRETTTEEAPENKIGREAPASRKGLIVGIASGAVALLAIVIAVVVWVFPHEEDETVEQPTSQESVQTAMEENSGSAELPEVAAGPLYQLDSIGTIDLSAKDHTPGSKQTGMTWDKTVFYWLETEPEGGGATGISTCDISRMQLYNTANGKVIEFVVYKDPASGAIYKIVSIEQRENDLLLTDFYYQDGKPNFIFRRGDSVYTPTYATIGKVGERYYFDQDVLVKWRLINTPNVIEEQTLTVDPDVSYAQTDYFTMDEDARNNYDAVEYNLLNLAYATYDRIVQGGAIGSVTGNLTDSAGNPLSGKTVRIYRSADDVLLYEGITDDTGAFRIYVYTDGTDCYLTVPGENIYRDLYARNLLLSMDVISYGYGRLILYGVEEPEHEVTFRLCDAASLDTGAGTEAAPLSGAAVIFREGIGARTGEAVLTVNADETGNVSARLHAGVYTAEVQREDYAPLYIQIEVSGAELVALGNYYLVPAPAAGQTAVLLTWEGAETDLDLTIFTPYQGEGGDMQRIGGSTLRDAYNNYILTDNGNGCELAYIDTTNLGAYKIYVNDYTDIQAGQYQTNSLLSLNIHIYIFGANGNMTEYQLPTNANGVVWEVAEISGGRVTASNRVYVDLTGKNWWTENKRGLSTAQREAYKEKIQELLAENWQSLIAYGMSDYYASEAEYYDCAEFYIVYIDDDSIPEIVCAMGFGEEGALDTHLLYLKENEVRDFDYYNYREFVNYIPFGSRLVYAGSSGAGANFFQIYSFPDLEHYEFWEEDWGVYYHGWNGWSNDGNTISEEEYYAAKDAAYNGAYNLKEGEPLSYQEIMEYLSTPQSTSQSPGASMADLEKKLNTDQFAKEMETIGFALANTVGLDLWFESVEHTDFDFTGDSGKNLIVNNLGVLLSYSEELLGEKLSLNLNVDGDHDVWTHATASAENYLRQMFGIEFQFSTQGFSEYFSEGSPCVAYEKGVLVFKQYYAGDIRDLEYAGAGIRDGYMDVYLDIVDVEGAKVGTVTLWLIPADNDYGYTVKGFSWDPA